MGDALRLAFLGGTQNLDGFLRSEGISQVAEIESRNELFRLHLGKELAIAGGAVGHTRPEYSDSPSNPSLRGLAPVAMRISLYFLLFPSCDCGARQVLDLRLCGKGLQI